MSDGRRSEALLEHLDAAYNLARWLMKNEPDARDVVQDAYIKAIRSKSEVDDLKTWFLATVRNTAYTALKKKPPLHLDEEASPPTPEDFVVQRADVERVRAAVMLLSEEHREIFVLREIEELSYEELAATLGVPKGTVMSRLARARSKIWESLRD